MCHGASDSRINVDASRCVASQNARIAHPYDRQRAREAVNIYLDVEAPLEQRAQDAFELVNDILSEVVGEYWWAESTKHKRIEDGKAARMGTIAAKSVVRIAHLACGLPIVDVGFGYGQVIWQLQMIGANVSGGMEIQSAYADIALDVQARCALDSLMM